MISTQEVARNPNPEILVRCSNCKNQYSMVSALQERVIDVDYSTIVEGVLECPNCQHTKHVYYMTEHLKNEQRLLALCAEEWQKTQTTRAYNKLMAKKASYQRAYDRVQNKYKRELGNGSH